MTKEHKKSFVVMVIFIILTGDGFMGVYIGKNFPNCTL